MDIKAIHSYLESSNLEVIVELTLDKYQGRDYYLSIVYDNEISKYKVLYLPINIVDYKKLDKYLCFQFIDQYYINYLIKNINDFKDEFKYVKARNYKNKYIDNDLITLTVKVGDEYYSFYATEYIPKELDYLYQVINIMFSYAPNIVSEVGRELVTLLEGKTTYIKYQKCIEFDLFESDLNYFENRNYHIDYLEFINSKYYAVVDDHLIILKYLKENNTLYLFSDNNNSKYYYSVIETIRKNQFKEFSKLKVFSTDGIERCYLSFNKNNKYYKIINGEKIERIPNDENVVEIKKDEI